MSEEGRIVVDVSNNEQKSNELVTNKSDTFVDIANIIRNQDNTARAMDTISKLQNVMYDRLITEEEELRRKREQEKIEMKKHSMKLELECLEIENMKMDSYLKTLSKKHELELLYLQEVCAQKQKIVDLSNSHPEINFDNIRPYGEYYREELITVTRNNNIVISHEPDNKPQDVKVRLQQPSEKKELPGPAKLSPRTRTLQQHESSNNNINLQRRNTVSGIDLQNQIKNALEHKFKHVHTGGSDEDEWK